MLLRIRSLKLESTVKRLRHFEEHARAIAQRLGKSDVCVDVEDRGVRLDAPRWGAFWATFIHAVRNAVDHGIEPTHERIAAGKPAVGHLALRTFQEADRIVIEIADDGKGIDWDALARRAEQLGLPTDSTADIERALFTDGVSTATAVSEVSGRGIGMGALLEKTHSLGGEVAVESVPGRRHHSAFHVPVVRERRGQHRAAPAQATNWKEPMTSLDKDPFSLMDRQLTEAAADLFGSYGLDVHRLPEHGPRPPGLPTDQSIVAVIGYAGEKVRGALVLVAQRATVERWLTAIGEPPETTDAFDTVGEFSNMLLGRLKARLSPQGFPILLSTPTTATGGGLRLSNPSGPSSWIAFQGSDWRLDVRLDATFEPGFALQHASERTTGADAGDTILF